MTENVGRFAVPQNHRKSLSGPLGELQVNILARRSVQRRKPCQHRHRWFEGARAKVTQCKADERRCALWRERGVGVGRKGEARKARKTRKVKGALLTSIGDQVDHLHPWQMRRWQRYGGFVCASYVCVYIHQHQCSIRYKNGAHCNDRTLTVSSLGKLYTSFLLLPT
jgi:hypothetical protein